MLFNFENVCFNSLIKYPNFSIKSGVATFICGDSGVGKSTLLKLMNGVLSPEDGNIFYKNVPLHDCDTIKLRQEVLLAGQSVYLFDKSIRENFHEYYNYRSVPAPRDEVIEKYLHICCADFGLDTLCTNMSGGERQRVYIAICLSFMPKAFLLDEPTSALDDHCAQNLIENLKSFCLNSKMTLIIVSHNMTLVNLFADDVIALTREDFA